MVVVNDQSPLLKIMPCCGTSTAKSVDYSTENDPHANFPACVSLVPIALLLHVHTHRLLRPQQEVEKSEFKDQASRSTYRYVREIGVGFIDVVYQRTCRKPYEEQPRHFHPISSWHVKAIYVCNEVKFVIQVFKKLNM